ncbi:MAG: glycosyltransferase family 1 protein [Nitrospinota bacterium]|nr:MAG: glycosyltransferase family 1 protein [Nitrospinota bacterium]
MKDFPPGRGHMYRILHSEASPGWGGQEMRILQETTEFTRRGYAMAIVCQPESGIGRQGAKEGKTLYRLRMRSCFDLQAVFQLRRLLQAQKIDLVHTHSSIDSWVAGLAAKSLRLPVVRSRHVSIPVKRYRNFNYNHLADRIIVNGEAMKRLLMQGGVKAEKIVSIPPGIDLTRFHPRIGGEKIRAEFALTGPVIGMIAMLRGSKGHTYFLQAARIVLQRYPEAHFLIVGDGVRRVRIQQEIEQLGLSRQVTMTGFRRDIPEILAALDLYVLSSLRETFPQTILQALAMRKPVVATDSGGVPEIIHPGATGLLVPPGDARALAEAILTLLADRGYAQRLACAGYELVRQEYTLERMIAKTEQVYRELLESS